jgi:hypothetical protein
MAMSLPSQRVEIRKSKKGCHVELLEEGAPWTNNAGKQDSKLYDDTSWLADILSPTYNWMADMLSRVLSAVLFPSYPNNQTKSYPAMNTFLSRQLDGHLVASICSHEGKEDFLTIRKEHGTLYTHHTLYSPYTTLTIHYTHHTLYSPYTILYSPHTILYSSHTRLTLH